MDIFMVTMKDRFRSREVNSTGRIIVLYYICMNRVWTLDSHYSS